MQPPKPSNPLPATQPTPDTLDAVDACKDPRVPLAMQKAVQAALDLQLILPLAQVSCWALGIQGAKQPPWPEDPDLRVLVEAAHDVRIIHLLGQPNGVPALRFGPWARTVAKSRHHDRCGEAVISGLLALRAYAQKPAAAKRAIGDLAAWTFRVARRKYLDEAKKIGRSNQRLGKARWEIHTQSEAAYIVSGSGVEAAVVSLLDEQRRRGADRERVGNVFKGEARERYLAALGHPDGLLGVALDQLEAGGADPSHSATKDEARRLAAKWDKYFRERM